MTCDCVPNRKSLEERFIEILFSEDFYDEKRILVNEFFMAKAEKVSFKATCKKRKIGCVLVTEKGVVLGANGAPEKIGVCKVCSRIDAKSGTQLERCYALHAEIKVLAECTKNGFSTKGGVIYLWGAMPCKNCLMALIESGVKEIVCNDRLHYDQLSKEILDRWVNVGGKLKWIE